MKNSLMFGFFLAFNLNLSAQTLPNASRSADTHNLKKNKGQHHFFVSPTYAPDSWWGLVEASQLIVRGILVQKLPSRYLGETSLIETDYEFMAKKIIKNYDDNRRDKIFISEMGGNVDGDEAIMDGNPLMDVGEEYFLFLTLDTRSGLPNYNNHRWSILGVWNGKFKILNNKVDFSRSSLKYISLIRKKDNLEIDPDQFETAINELVLKIRR